VPIPETPVLEMPVLDVRFPTLFIIAKWPIVAELLAEIGNTLSVLHKMSLPMSTTSSIAAIIGATILLL
jgi:hypothetical protein